MRNLIIQELIEAQIAGGGTASKEEFEAQGYSEDLFNAFIHDVTALRNKFSAMSDEELLEDYKETVIQQATSDFDPNY